VLRTSEDPRQTTLAYRTSCGNSTPHHTNVPARGSPQTSSNKTPHQSRYIHTQGSPQVHARFSPTELNSSGTRTSLSGPYQALSRNHKTLKLLVREKPITVSVGRVNPAHIFNEDNCGHTTFKPVTTVTPATAPSEYHHRFQRSRLHAPDNISVFPYASPSQHQFPRGGDVGTFHGNLPHVANIGDQLNSSNLQVSIAMHCITIAYTQQYRSAVAMIRSR
jgi:hypothetical protein